MRQPKPTRGDAYQDVPRPVGAMARDLPAAFEIDWHSHPRFQLIFAVRGVMSVDTQEATWLVPPQRAVWMPARSNTASTPYSDFRRCSTTSNCNCPTAPWRGI